MGYEALSFSLRGGGVCRNSLQNLRGDRVRENRQKTNKHKRKTRKARKETQKEQKQREKTLDFGKNTKYKNTEIFTIFFRNSVRLETWKFHGFSSNLI